MKTININGTTQSGKTEAALSLVRQMSEDHGAKCLVVFPTSDAAYQGAIRYQYPECKKDVVCCGSSRFNAIVNRSRWDVIALMDIDRFDRNDESDYLKIAEQRLIGNHFATLILVDGYTLNGYKWASKAIWYKPWTWSRGHYANTGEIH